MEHKEPDIEPNAPTAQVQERRVVQGPVAPEESEVVSTFNPGWRAVQFVYLVFGIIDGLLLIRLVLKLLGANPEAAFSNWIYNVTAIFLAPFHNILPTIGNAQSQLETSVVLRSWFMP